MITKKGNIIGIFSLLLLCACKPQMQEQLTQLPAALIGGSTEQTADYTATLRIMGSCTAAKIGPRHILTAAHCVINNQTADFKATYQKGKILKLQNTKATQEVAIESVYAHQSYVAAVKYANSIGFSPNNVGKHSFDVAVVVTQSDITIADEAEVDFEAVTIGDELIVGGYGCEIKVGGAPPAPSRYKIGKTSAVGIAALKGARGNYGDKTTQVLIYLHNVLTNGQGLDASAPSICPGDSGGPVYRANAKDKIVGVNAYYSFNDTNGISHTNWHTRLAVLKSWFDEIGSKESVSF